MQASEKINKYLERGTKGGVILKGPRGTEKLSSAFDMAKRMLCLSGGLKGCECASCTLGLDHPDLLLIKRQEGKRYMGVSEANSIVDFATTLPLVADNKVVVISEFDKMDIQAQNKLLKTLESGQDKITVIATSEGDLLDTITSRMEIINFRALSLNEFRKINFESEELCYIYYYLSAGCRGLVEELKEMEGLFKKVVSAYKSNNPAELFHILNLVKEKDTKAFFKTKREYLVNLFLLIENLLLEQLEIVSGVGKGRILKEQKVDEDMNEILEKLRVVREHRIKCNSISYTQDSLTECIIDIC